MLGVITGNPSLTFRTGRSCWAACPTIGKWAVAYNENDGEDSRGKVINTET